MNASNISPDARQYSAILRPHRSLSPRGYTIVMAIVAAVNLFFAVYFAFIGAPVMILFCVIDFLAVLLAFELSFRNARTFEHIEMTPDLLTVERVSFRGERARWRFQPFWTHIVLERHDEHQSDLKLVSKGRSLTIGAFMASNEKERFAEALTRALVRMRAPGP